MIAPAGQNGGGTIEDHEAIGPQTTLENDGTAGKKRTQGRLGLLSRVAYGYKHRGTRREGNGRMLWLWLIVFVIVLALDLLTFTLVGSALAAASIVTFVVTALGLRPWESVVFFLLMGALSLALLRPYLVRLLMRSADRPHLAETREPVHARGFARTRITDRGGEIVTWEGLPWTTEAGQGGPDGPTLDKPWPGATFWSAAVYPPGTVIEAGTRVEILYREGGNLVVRAIEIEMETKKAPEPDTGQGPEA